MTCSVKNLEPMVRLGLAGEGLVGRAEQVEVRGG